MRKLLLLFFCFALAGSQLLAQSRSISGRVTDEKGDPLVGASVVVKGAATGTTTTAGGSFSLSVASAARTLVISYQGFAPQEVVIGSRTSISVTLAPENAKLDEVVVVAYGTQKRESVTGSVATVGAAQLETRLTTNITQALAGAAPGIAATSGNGQPGSGAAIRIRGFGSINASSAPLYVVDGFPYEGFLSDLNTNDIETISILKDASSTALYGARAANGVVLITTKKGKTADPKVNISFTSGFSQRGIPEYDRVGTNDYYPVMWQALKNSLQYPASGTGGLSESAAAAQASAQIANQLIYNPYNVPNDAIVGVDGKLNPNATLLYNDFDWFSPLAINGNRNEVAMSTSAKVNKSDYYVSLNYLKDEGFVLGSDFERASARISLNSQVKSWLRSGINMSGVVVRANQARASSDDAGSIVNPFVFARRIGPIYPIRAYTATGQPVLDANGNHVYDFGQHAGAVNRPQGAFPGRHVLYETMLNSLSSSRNSLIARTFLEGTFFKSLTFTTNVGIDLNNTRGKGFQNRIVGDGVTAGGTASSSSDEYRTISMNQLLNYKRSFGKSDISFLAGHENQWVNENYFSGNRRGMNLDGNQELVNFVTLNGVTGRFENLRRDAYLSRINYDYNNKYFFEVSYRRDGSSRFSPKSRWGNFYSVGGSWFIKRENFLSNVDWLNDLKVRASYGTVGNDALLDANGNPEYYSYQALYGLNFNNATEPGALATKLPNEDLTWEVNNTLSFGVDFGMFKNRLSGTLELFERGSSDLLFSVPQGFSSVVTTRNENIGSMSNKGIELQLNADIVKAKNTKWDLQLNFTTLKNEIKKLPNGQPITDGTKRLEEGRDIFGFYLRQWYGVDPDDGSGLYYAKTGLTTGFRITKTGDTVVTNPTNAKFDYSGTAIPKFFGSIGSNVDFRGIGLSFLLNYQVGGKFYDANYAGLLTPSYGAAIHQDVLRAWKAPGDITDMPRLDIASASNFNSQSSRFLIDASYLSIRNVSLSYALGRNILSTLHVSQLKFFVSGENLAVFSKRKGLNPAESFNGTNSSIYTPNRTFSAGLNLNF